MGESPKPGQPVVVREIPRINSDLGRRLAAAGVATVHEAQHRTGLMHSSMRPVRSGLQTCGQAVTALGPAGDNLILHVALELLFPGSVLVYSTTSPTESGAAGELVCLAAERRGAVALVIDAGVRDVSALRQMQVGVWSRTISAAGTAKASPGWANVPITCAGVTVRPGDLVVADDDGVVVVPLNDAAAVAARAEVRIRREEELRRRILAGELSLDFSGYRKTVEELGLPYL